MPKLSLNLRSSLIIAVVAVLASFDSAIAQEKSIASGANKRIKELIESGKTEMASRSIELHLKQKPHDLQVQLLRRQLGTLFLRNGRRDDGEAQFEKLLRYIFEHPEKARSIVKYVPQTILSLSSVQQGAEPKASEFLDGAMQVLKKAVDDQPTSSAISNGLSSMVGLKTRLLARNQKWVEVVQLLEAELDRLRARWRSDLGNPDRWLRLVYMLGSAVQTIGFDGYDVYSLINERRNLLRESVTRFPDSVPLIQEAFSDRLKAIAEFEETAPRTASKMYEQARIEIRNAVDASNVKKPLYTVRMDVEKAAQRFKRAENKNNLAGIEIEIPQANWLNDEPRIRGVGVEAILFVRMRTKTDQELLAKIHQLLLANKTNAVILTCPMDDSFNRLPIVNRNKTVTDELRKEYRDSLVEKVIDAYDIEMPFGILDDTMSIADAFGIGDVPMICILKNGKCERTLEGSATVSELEKHLQAK